VHATVVGDGQICFSVAIEVKNRDERRKAPGYEGTRCLEGSIAFAQQHAHAVVRSVGHREVCLAISVEVTFRDGGRVVADGIIHRGMESPVAVPEEHAHISTAENDNCDVRITVAVAASHPYRKTAAAPVTST